MYTLNQLFEKVGGDTRFIFYAKFNKFEVRVFFLQHKLPYQC